MKKKIPILLLLMLSMYIIHFKYLHRTKGFCLEKILSAHGEDPRYQVNTSIDLDQIFSSPFTYLGSGKECYAFLSSDKQYVIKFFKQKHMKATHPLRPLSFIPVAKEYVEKKKTKRLALREKMFQSYLIAFDHLKEETGLLYLHLSKTNHLKKKALFYDQHNKSFILDLDRMEFLIQRRATPIFTAFEQFHQKGDDDKAKEAIDSIVHLIHKRRSLGIGDEDINCERNLGLIGTKAVEIDIGEFFYSSSQVDFEDEVEKATTDLKEFLHNLNPTWAEYLEHAI